PVAASLVARRWRKLAHQVWSLVPPVDTAGNAIPQQWDTVWSNVYRENGWCAVDRSELLRNEARLAQAVVAEAPEAIVVANVQGLIVAWNRGAEKMFGYAASEVLGASLDVIIPEKLRARHWAGWEKVVATGVTQYGDDQLLAVPATHRDGRRLSLEFSIALLRDETGDPAAFSAVMREVSERRRAEQGLRRRLAELESQGQ
ncbi:MAG: PAS domain-containing protein, partial [Sciscionella sp.]